MTDTTWAEKVLADVPRYKSGWRSTHGEDIRYDDALAAIAKLGAGDDMVERLQKLADDMGKHATEEWDESELVNAAIAHIAALTAERDEYADQISALLPAVNREAVEQRARAEAAEAQIATMIEACRGYEEQIAALTAQVAENRISEPHDPGDFVGDIYFGHPVKTTMGTHRWTGSEWVKLPSETEVLMGLLADARSERDALRAKVARLEGALALYSCEDGCNDCPQNERDRVAGLPAPPLPMETKKNLDRD